MARRITERRPVLNRRARFLAMLIAALAVVFTALALAMRRAEGALVDVTITAAIQQIDDPMVAALMHAISVPGFWPWSWLILAVTVVGFSLAGYRREGLFVLLTSGAGMLASTAKVLIERPRPVGEGIRVVSELLDYSYPSGHVVGYVTFYGFVLFLTFVLFKRSWWRTAMLVVPALLVGLVGISRIYLGHHWVSDVVGGYALGSLYLIVLIELYRASASWRKPRREPSRKPADNDLTVGRESSA